MSMIKKPGNFFHQLLKRIVRELLKVSTLRFSVLFLLVATLLAMAIVMIIDFLWDGRFNIELALAAVVTPVLVGLFLVVFVNAMFDEIREEAVRRKRTEIDLRESERRFRDLLKNVELISMTLDREARITYCNEYLLRLTGWKREEIIGRNWFDIFAPPELNYLKDSFFETLLANRPEARHHENEILTRSDERLLIHWNNSVLRSTEGDVIGTASIGENITEYKKMVFLLAEKENRLRTLVNSIPDLIWVKDAEGFYQSCNPMFERFFGAREADIVGKTDFDFVDSELAASFREHDRIAMAASKPSVNEEWVVFADDGHRALLETVKTPMRDAGGKLLGVLGISRDITERKAAEDAIHKSNIELSLFRKLIDNSNDAIEVFEPGTMRFLDMNETECRELGYSREELLSMCVYDVDTGFNKDLAEPIEQQVRQTGSVRFDSIHRRKDGSTFPVEISVKLIEVDKPYLLSIARDISERKRLELEKEQYFKFFNLSINPMCIADPYGCFTQVNPAFSKLTGYSEIELVSKPFLDFVLPEDRQRTEGEMKLQVEKRPTLYFDNRYLCKDGSVIDLSWTAYYDKQDGITYATAIDTTESKRTDESLRKLSQAVEQSPSAIAITDLKANIEYVNEGFIKVSGYSRAELVGSNPRLLQSGKTPRASYTDMWAHLLRGETWKGEFTNRRKDGSEYIEYVLASPVRQADGRVTHYLSIKEDITQLKHAQQASQASRENLDRLLNSMAEGAYGVDTNGDCTFVNRAFLRMLGYQNESEVLGKNTHELIHHSHADGSPYPANECVAFRAFGHDRAINVSNEVFWRKDGLAVSVEYWSYPIESDGATIGSIVTFIDITQRKQAEAELAEQLEELRRWHDVTSGREARILELKHEVNELLGQVGKHPRYPSAESENPTEIDL
jgi:PAS domain S-box-containing protein